MRCKGPNPAFHVGGLNKASGIGVGFNNALAQVRLRHPLFRLG